jgi:hypothetical protein
MMSTKELPKDLEKHLEERGLDKGPDGKHDKGEATRGIVQFNFDLDTPSPSSGTLEKYIKNVLGNDSHNAIPDLLKPPGESHPHEKDLHSEPIPMSISSSIQQQHQQQHQNMPGSIAVQSSSEKLQVGHPSNPPQTTSITTTENNEMIPVPKGQSYVDISEYLNMPQSEAAKKLGIPPSTLSKRWKEAVRKRKWPYRMICKIDKEIMTLLHNVPQGANAPPLPEEIETALGLLLRKRQEELRAVVIRI